jgi:hypothetical protein
MNVPASHASLIAVGRRYWLKFLPMWLFPVGFFFTRFLPEGSTRPGQYLYLWVPVVLICLWVANLPRREGAATWFQTMFWATLVPFLIWVGIIAAMIGLTLARTAV